MKKVEYALFAPISIDTLLEISNSYKYRKEINSIKNVFYKYAAPQLKPWIKILTNSNKKCLLVTESSSRLHKVIEINNSTTLIILPKISKFFGKLGVVEGIQLRNFLFSKSIDTKECIFYSHWPFYGNLVEFISFKRHYNWIHDTPKYIKFIPLIYIHILIKYLILALKKSNDRTMIYGCAQDILNQLIYKLIFPNIRCNYLPIHINTVNEEAINPAQHFEKGNISIIINNSKLKGHDLMEKYLKYLIDEFDSINVIGNVSNEVINKYSSYVNFTGPISHKKVISTLKESNMLISFSRSEVIPGIILESRALGLNVVTNNVGDLENLFKNDNGIVFVDFTNELKLLENIEMVVKQSHIKNTNYIPIQVPKYGDFSKIPYFNKLK